MLILALFAALLVAAPAHAIIRLPAVPAQVADNPAERLGAQPIEDSVYDPATHCSRKQQPGMVALQRWLEANVRGVSWGTYRCEKWGKHQPRSTPRAARSTGTSMPTTPLTAAPP